LLIDINQGDNLVISVDDVSTHSSRKSINYDIIIEGGDLTLYNLKMVYNSSKRVTNIKINNQIVYSGNIGSGDLIHLSIPQVLEEGVEYKITYDIPDKIENNLIFKTFFNAECENEYYDFAIIGDCNNDEMRFSFRPDKPVICYKPSVYIDNLIRFPKASALTDKDDVFSLVTTANVGTHLGKDGCRYEAFNNKYWIKHEFMNLDTITTDNNIIFCNGWVLPQHLIQEGYMEV